LINNRIKKLNDQQNFIKKKVDLLQNKYVKNVLIKTEKVEVSKRGLYNLLYNFI